MRVLMISYTSLLQRAYRKKCDEICRQGDVDLTVLTPFYWKEWWSPGGKVEFEAGAEDEAYRCVQAPIVFSGNGHLAFFRRGMGALLSDVRPDIIDIEREPWCWASAQALRNLRRRCPEARMIFHASQSLMKWYPPPFRWIEQAVFRRAECALARSETAAGILRARGFSGNIRVVPHGVDTERFAPAPDRDHACEPVIGYVGALTRHKGVDVLIQALALLPSEIHCLILGDGPEKPKLEDLASRLGVASRIEFVGTVSHRDIPGYLRRMSVFVLPTRSLPGWEERFGRVLLEAMATGLPVVGSNCGEIPSVIGDGGVVFPEQDPDGLARAVEGILNRPEEARALGVRARQRVESKYSWSVVARQTLEAYRSILG